MTMRGNTPLNVRLGDQTRLPVSQSFTGHAHSESTSVSVENFRRKQGCIKVSDPYYGKRKPSNTLRRIQRKISLLESRMKLAETQETEEIHRQPGTQNGNGTRNKALLGRTVLAEEVVKNGLETEFKNTEHGIPRIEVVSSESTEKEKSCKETEWMTQDELLGLLFRLL